ncbi:MAG: hypothetical protein C5B50_18935 [Verrucomicrobia bacterium]|nr:MAG: hypothetical protein C5B50_18935 [Verrucomicrobiota bacterium]
MPYHYRIQEITFSDSSTLSLPNLTVIVGPNNSGKSRALKDILKLTTTNNKSVLVVGRALTNFPQNAKELESTYGISPILDHEGQAHFRFLQPTLHDEQNIGYGGAVRKWPDDFDAFVKRPDHFLTHFGAQLPAMLTTEGRLSLVSQKPSAVDPHQAANLLQVLYASGREKELEIRQIVSEAFPGIQIVLDFTIPQRLDFKVGTDFSNLPPDPRDARATLVKCERLDDQGDGLRSYVGIAVARTTLRRPVVLIDEPEAFLHPPQAFRIGQFIASQASPERQVIVATHSADVLRGVIFKANDVLVARIDRAGDNNVVNTLDPVDLRRLTADPLLSAAGVLNGLFYSGVVVTEADADSRFYQLVSNKVNTGLDFHFVNADNKQTVPKVLAAYKKLGMECAGVVDIDVLNNPEEFNKQLEAAAITGDPLTKAQEAREKIDAEVRATPASARLETARKRISEMKAAADAALAGNPNVQEKILDQLRRESEKLKADASGWQVLKKGGVAALKNTRAEFEKLYAICGAAGLFINPSGELEASLSDYGVHWEADKRAWITRAVQLVPNLEVNLDKQPWRLISDVHDHLRKREV